MERIPENPENRREMSPEKKERTLEQLEEYLKELRRDIEILKGRLISTLLVTHDKNSPVAKSLQDDIEALKVNAAGLEEMLGLGREEDSKGFEKDTE